MSIKLTSAVLLCTIMGLSFSLFSAPIYSNAVQAQDLISRKILKQNDLSSNGNMQVIMASLELKLGTVIPRHTHKGDEYLYIVSGGKAESTDKKLIDFKTGSTVHLPCGVPHAGLRIVGDKTLKALTIHIVDKDNPLIVLVNKPSFTAAQILDHSDFCRVFEGNVRQRGCE